MHGDGENEVLYIKVENSLQTFSVKSLRHQMRSLMVVREHKLRTQM